MAPVGLSQYSLIARHLESQIARQLDSQVSKKQGSLIAKQLESQIARQLNSLIAWEAGKQVDRQRARQMDSQVVIQLGIRGIMLLIIKVKCKDDVIILNLNIQYCSSLINMDRRTTSWGRRGGEPPFSPSSTPSEYYLKNRIFLTLLNTSPPNKQNKENQRYGYTYIIHHSYIQRLRKIQEC